MHCLDCYAIPINAIKFCFFMHCLSFTHLKHKAKLNLSFKLLDSGV